MAVNLEIPDQDRISVIFDARDRAILIEQQDRLDGPADLVKVAIQNVPHLIAILQSALNSAGGTEDDE